MPHKRHRVRVHVHNRYVRTQPAQQNKCCKKRCRNGSRCRRGGDEPSRQEDDCDRVIIAGPDAPRGCQRFHSAEEVCRKGCGGARGRRAEDQRAATERAERYGGYESPDGDREPCNRDPCNRCGKARTAGGDCGCDKRGGSRPGTPCERFKSAEETCRSCPKRPGDRQRYRDTGGGGQRNFTVYTAQVQQLEFSGKPYATKVAQETNDVTKPVAIPPCGKTSNFPPCPDPNEITEEIIHTREHRWHIPSARQLAAAYPCDPPPADPCDPPPCDRGSVARRRGPCSSSSSLGSVPRSKRGVGEPGGVRRTRSELLAGRELVSRIARQVELDDGAGHQLVYRLSAQYTGVGQFADYSQPDSGSESGSESERPPLPSEHGTERSTQTAETVRRLTLLRLSDVSVTASSSDGGLVVFSASPRPAPRSARPAEPPAPLPRRQVTSEPALPAPTAPAPAPATRTTRSLDCQPVPVGAGDGRTKRLRTRGALTRLRQRSVTRLNEERHRQMLNERPVTQIIRQPAGKPPPDRPSDTDNERRDVTVLYAQNLLPNDYQGGPGSRGDAAAAEPIYQNIDALYNDTAVKPADGAGYSGGGGGGGGGFEPVEPGSASPYLSRAADPYQPDPAADDRYSVAGRSPYLDTSPTGRSARARFDDDDELGAALYEQRYQPRRDSSPYLSRPTGRAADPEPAQTGAPLQRQGAPLQRQGGQQQLGAAGRRGQGIGQRLTSGFTSLRQRGAALYRKLSGGRGRGAAAGRGRGRGRGAAASQPVGRSGTAAKGRRSGGADSCSCTDSDSDCGAVNCSFLFYFNGDGGPSPFMSNIPGAITGAGGAQRGGAGSMPRKYCGMCD